jgi:hypothetical protein
MLPAIFKDHIPQTSSFIQGESSFEFVLLLSTPRPTQGFHFDRKFFNAEFCECSNILINSHARRGLKEEQERYFKSNSL